MNAIERRDRRDRLEFLSYDGRDQVRTAQGDHCVMLMIVREFSNVSTPMGIVLTDSEAEALGRGLIRRAKASRR